MPFSPLERERLNEIKPLLSEHPRSTDELMHDVPVALNLFPKVFVICVLRHPDSHLELVFCHVVMEYTFPSQYLFTRITSTSCYKEICLESSPELRATGKPCFDHCQGLLLILKNSSFHLFSYWKVNQIICIVNKTISCLHFHLF